MYFIEYRHKLNHSVWRGADNGREHHGITSALNRAKEIAGQGFYCRVKSSSGAILWNSELNPNLSTKEDANMGTMNVEKPLHIPRETLIEKIQAAYDESKAKARAKYDEKIAARKPKLDEVRKAMDETPLAFIRFIETYFSSIAVQDADKGIQGFAAMVKENYNGEDADFEYTEEQTEKLLSVLEAATDKELEVTPNDDLYRYL